MAKAVLARIRDMPETIDELERATAGKSLANFQQDWLLIALTGQHGGVADRLRRSRRPPRSASTTSQGCGRSPGQSPCGFNHLLTILCLDDGHGGNPPPRRAVRAGLLHHPQPCQRSVKERITASPRQPGADGAVTRSADRIHQKAAERSIEIISEASRHLTDDLKARHPSPRWRHVAAIGNVLRHEYHRADGKIVWAVIVDELPGLKLHLQAMRAEIEAAQGAADGKAGKKPC
jgi:uncharacterized protein with HEPN domain